MAQWGGCMGGQALLWVLVCSRRMLPIVVSAKSLDTDSSPQ